MQNVCTMSAKSEVCEKIYPFGKTKGLHPFFQCDIAEGSAYGNTFTNWQWQCKQKTYIILLRKKSLLTPSNSSLFPMASVVVSPTPNTAGSGCTKMLPHGFHPSPPWSSSSSSPSPLPRFLLLSAIVPFHIQTFFCAHTLTQKWSPYMQIAIHVFWKACMSMHA